MKYLFAIGLAAATTLHLFQYYSSVECDTPPDSVYVFEVSKPKSSRKPENETWPKLYTNRAPMYPFFDCGNLKVGIPGHCCTSFETPIDSFNINSVSLLDSKQLPAEVARFPAVMNGLEYCVLEKIFNYTELYIGPTGYCVEDMFKCDKSGSLIVYSGQNCTGDFRSIRLSAEPLNLNFGSFNASLRSINYATGAVGWTEFVTKRTTTIKNFYPSEIIATACYVLILILEICLLVYFANRYYVARLNPVLLHLICHCLWLVYVGLSIQYTYHRWGDYERFLDILIARSFFFGLANLVTAISTTNFIIVFWKLGKRSRFALYVGVILVHFGFLGGRYLYAGFPRTDFSDLRFQYAITFWTNRVSFVWIIFLFVYDLLPIIYLSSNVPALIGTQSRGIRKAFEFARVDRISTLLLIPRIFIVSGYFVNEYIRSSTPFLGNDRNHQATAAYTIFFIVLHSALNTIVVYRIARQVKDGSLFSQLPVKSSGDTVHSL